MNESKNSMSRILNSWILGFVAVAVVAISGVVFILAAMNADDTDGQAASEGASSGEQRVLFSNLGMT